MKLKKIVFRRKRLMILKMILDLRPLGYFGTAFGIIERYGHIVFYFPMIEIIYIRVFHHDRIKRRGINHPYWIWYKVNSKLFNQWYFLRNQQK